MSLFLSLFFLFSLCISLCLSASPYYLQVGHQASGVTDELTFVINGQQLAEFTHISYGGGSMFVDISSSLFSNNPTVSIEVFNKNADLIADSTIEMTRAFHSYFVITVATGKTRTIYYSWETHYPATSTWFIFVNLAPSQMGDVTFQINGDALVKTLDYLERSDVYTGVAGAYEFIVKNQTDQLTSQSYQLQPGAIETMILNEDLKGGYTLFKLKDYQSVYYSSSLRAVQAVPDKKAYVWLGGQESWQGLKYKTVTPSEFVSASETEIYVSLTATKPATPALTYTFTAYTAYSLLITGDPDNGVDLQASILIDTNFAPIYTKYTARVAYLPPQGLPVEVFLNGKDLGSVHLNEASLYDTQDPSDADTNVTITNREFTFEDEIDGDEFDAGSAFSIFVLGTYNEDPNQNEMELVTALDFASSDIEKLEDQIDHDDDDQDDDDDDDDDGLSGGAIAGIVIGVLAGVALIVAFGFYVRRRATNVPSQADYESIPTNHFL